MSEINLDEIQNIQWVTTELQLKELCDHWSQLPMIAVDTEFMRTNTYYPKPALIQINDGSVNYLIDPLVIDDLSSMTALMLNERVQKVLHSCSEDLEVFNRLLSCLPVNLYDTQIAAAFCGYGFSVGYAGLVKSLLNIDLPKGETRSNWLHRPLTSAQIKYAALDVDYLFTVAGLLQSKLQATPQEQWVKEECLGLFEAYSATQVPENGIQRFKNAWKLNAKNVETLQALSIWREKEAQQRNMPRNFVIKEKALFQIAETLPSQMKQFRGIDEFSEKSAQRYGNTILDIVKSIELSESSPLLESLPKPLTGTQKTLIKHMREQLTCIAEALSIAPEYLARKKDFEYMARAITAGVQGDDVFPQSLSGWRTHLVKDKILALI